MKAAASYGLELPDRALAGAAIDAPAGQPYVGATGVPVHCPLANRQNIAHGVRQAMQEVMQHAEMA